jgi:xanthine/uracil permease
MKMWKKGAIIGAVWSLVSALPMTGLFYIGLEYMNGDVSKLPDMMVNILVIPVYMAYFYFSKSYYFILSILIGTFIGSIIGLSIEKYKQRSAIRENKEASNDNKE